MRKLTELEFVTRFKDNPRMDLKSPSAVICTLILVKIRGGGSILHMKKDDHTDRNMEKAAEILS